MTCFCRGADQYDQISRVATGSPFVLGLDIKPETITRRRGRSRSHLSSSGPLWRTSKVVLSASLTLSPMTTISDSATSSLSTSLVDTTPSTRGLGGGPTYTLTLRSSAASDGGGGPGQTTRMRPTLEREPSVFPRPARTLRPSSPTSSATTTPVPSASVSTSASRSTSPGWSSSVVDP